MADLFGVEMKDVGADDIVGQRVFRHDDDPEMMTVLGQMIAPKGRLDCVCSDEIRTADLDEVDNLFVKVVIVVPHPLSVAEDADVELECSRETMGQGVGLELRRIDKEVPFGDFPRGSDFPVDLARLKRDGLWRSR